MKKNTEISAYIGLVITFILWGSLYVVSNILLTQLPTFTVAFIRFIIAYLFLTVLSHFHNSDKKFAIQTSHVHNAKTDSRLAKPDREGWKYIFILGFLGYALFVGLQLLGTKFAGSSTASLINALNPVSISLMAVLVLKEKLTKSKIAGMILSVSGVYMIVGTGAHINITGIVLSLLSVIGWSFVSVITRRGLSKYQPLMVTRYAIGVAAICNLVLCIIENIYRQEPVHFSAGSIAGLLYMGICCTAVAYILWNKGLAALPASNCSAFYPLQPLTSTVLGCLILHEEITLWFVIGALCIVCGILICLLWPVKSNVLI